MRLLDRLDRKYSKYAIHNLMFYIVIANAAVFLFDSATGGQLSSLLILVPSLVMQGQVWRLITFIFLPPSTSMLFLFFVLYFYNMIGQALEHQWGSFKFNVYYFLGVIFTIIASMISYFFMDYQIIGTSTYLNMTLFLAFATFYPNFQIRLFFILPLKVKYLAYVDVVLLLYAFVTGGNTAKLLVVASIANYLLFFGKDLYRSITGTAKNRVRKQQYNNRMNEVKAHQHKCYVCGRTEKDDPSLEFRFCSKCDGYYEYCSDHLKDHVHIKEPD